MHNIPPFVNKDICSVFYHIIYFHKDQRKDSFNENSKTKNRFDKTARKMKKDCLSAVQKGSLRILNQLEQGV